MTSKELYEKMSTVMIALPAEDDSARQEFADLMRQLNSWLANPSHVNTIRVWLRHAGY